MTLGTYPILLLAGCLQLPKDSGRVRAVFDLRLPIHHAIVSSRTM